MYLIIADGHGSPLELSPRRDRFFAEAFAYAIALHAAKGTVTLHPGGQTLHVGSDADCYERVRVFSEDWFLIGTMSLDAEGRVSWTELLRPPPNAGRLSD